MQTRTWIVALALGAGTLLGACAAGSRAHAQDPEPVGFDMAAMTEALELARPGPEHEELAARAGEWSTVATLYVTPGAAPLESRGSASARPILGGRFLEVVSTGDFMGQPFESRSILGFDRRHERYTIVGFDTMGTYWVTGQGTRGEDGVIRMHGVDEDLTGAQVYTFEYELLSPDEHEYRVVFHELGGRKFEQPFTMVSVRSTRVE